MLSVNYWIKRENLSTLGGMGISDLYLRLKFLFKGSHSKTYTCAPSCSLLRKLYACVADNISPLFSFSVFWNTHNLLCFSLVLRQQSYLPKHCLVSNAVYFTGCLLFLQCQLSVLFWLLISIKSPEHEKLSAAPPDGEEQMPFSHGGYTPRYLSFLMVCFQPSAIREPAKVTWAQTEECISHLVGFSCLCSSLCSGF